MGKIIFLYKWFSVLYKKYNPELKKMKKKDIPYLTEILDNMFPNATIELYYTNEFQLLIAILMSAQATDKQVNKVNRNFFNFLKNPEDGVRMDIDYIKDFINTISFFNNKAKYIKETSKILLEKYHGKIPKKLNELTKLPGVWIKTAKVFLAIVANAPYIGVDTHVHRVLNRLGIVSTKKPEETDKVITKNFTKKDHAKLHHTLVLFGRYHCQAKKPKCKTCWVKQKCNFYKKTN